MNILSENKKAYFDYHIQEKLEAGISLLGHEVKSIKSGKMSLKGAYVILKDGQVFLIGAHVSPYQPKNISQDYNPERIRTLLLNKKEIGFLAGKIKEKGLTLVPLKVYTIRGIIKLQIGIAKGKKKADKREKIKKRDIKRDLERTLKGDV